jgi:hypothetical protein
MPDTQTIIAVATVACTVFTAYLHWKGKAQFAEFRKEIEGWVEQRFAEKRITEFRLQRLEERPSNSKVNGLYVEGNA